MAFTALASSVPCRPYSTSDKDIIDFFAEYTVIEVAFVYEPDGRPSGLVSNKLSVSVARLVRWMLPKGCHIC